MKQNQYVVGKKEAGCCLIDFLSFKLNISKKKSKNLLNKRIVFVNSNRTWMARHVLERGDIIDVMAGTEPRKTPSLATASACLTM